MIASRVLSALAAAALLAGCSTGTAPAEPAPASSPAAAPNEADLRFTTGMISHHLDGVTMSEEAADRAVTPEVRALASRIIGAQAAEVETMRSWLAEWDAPAGAAPAPHGHAPSGSHDPLSSAEGVEYDRLWLAAMVEHHEMALEMAQEELSEGVAPESLALASAIVDDQTAEIEEMRSLGSRSAELSPLG